MQHFPLNDLPDSIDLTKEYIEYFDSELMKTLNEELDEDNIKYLNYLQRELCRYCNHLVELNAISY